MPALLYHKQPPPHYDLPHHLLYHTFYGAEPFSRPANNTTSRGVNLFPPLFPSCCWAQHLTLHMSNGDCSPTRPASHAFSLWIPPSSPLSLSFLLLCSEQGRGGVCRFTCVTAARGRDWCSAPFWAGRQSSSGNLADTVCVHKNRKMTGGSKGNRERDRDRTISEYGKGEK